MLGRLETVTAVKRNNVLVDVDSAAAGVQPDVTVHTYDLVGNLDTTKYSNGLIHDYDYDSLNRLDELYHWKDKADSNGIFNGDRDENEILAKFDYELRADGKRIGATEWFSHTGGQATAFTTNTFTWEYDAAGRLTSELAVSGEANNALDGAFADYDLDFIYDLTGNRLKQTKTSGGSTETTDYVYDANDRLSTETISESTAGSTPTNIDYTYNKTQQTSKVTTEHEEDLLGEPVTITTTQTFEYNLQGKLAKSATTRSGGNAVGNDLNSSTVYEYDSAGNRIAATTTKEGLLGGISTTRIEYLTDSQNPTGYSQVLTETEYAVNGTTGEIGAPIKQVVYTIGHDQISQTVYENWNPTTNNFEQAATHHFGTDGHGSVRVLYDAAAAIAQNATGHLQVYHFDAYGNLLNENAIGKALTVYLYSGEAFDFNIGLQYLRSRLYDPNTGRFLSLDPFAGNSDDPQSFHKYAYVHGDPIQGVDPSGEMLALSLGGLFLPGPSDFIIGGLQALVTAYVVNLEWDIDWAFDFSMPDDWGSRSDNSWVASALMAGVRDSFRIEIPFTNIGFNPVDFFAQRGTGIRGPSGGSSFALFRGANKAMHSFSPIIEYAGKGRKALFAQVSFFYHVKLDQHIIRFPDNVIAKKLPIKPNGPSRYGKQRWEDLTENQQSALRSKDIADATKKLKNRNGELPAGWEQRGQNIYIDGVSHTWHHGTKKGSMELVPTDLHSKSQIGKKKGGTGALHIGMALWWKEL